LAEGLRDDHTSQEMLAIRNREPRMMAAICTFSITVREMACHWRERGGRERKREVEGGRGGSMCVFLVEIIICALMSCSCRQEDVKRCFVTFVCIFGRIGVLCFSIHRIPLIWYGNPEV
jgi:hypothetical protein